MNINGGNSDPGTSGLLSPFALIEGLHFNPDDEPCGFYYDLLNDLSKRYEGTNIKFIKCEFDNPTDFYNALTDMQKYTNDNIRVSGTSKAGSYELVINEEHDIDDPTKPSTVALAKKKKKKPEEEVIEEVEDTNDDDVPFDESDDSED